MCQNQELMITEEDLSERLAKAFEQGKAKGRAELLEQRDAGNPFKVDGKPIIQFKPYAEAWDDGYLAGRKQI